jgi:hypothetical protein
MLWRSSKWLSVASLAINAMAGRSRPGRIASGLLGVAGGLTMRYSILEAGRASARDPHAVFESQRG